MNEMNMGESYYIIAGEKGCEEADHFKYSILPNLPIKIITNYFGHIIESARIKARHPTSCMDCFAVATAIRKKAVIVTGDRTLRR